MNGQEAHSAAPSPEVAREDGARAGSVTAPDRAHILPTVPGGSESRGALRKMSDLLELMVKRMDMLARLENSSELHRTASVAHLAADR